LKIEAMRWFLRSLFSRTLCRGATSLDPFFYFIEPPPDRAPQPDRLRHLAGAAQPPERSRSRERLLSSRFKPLETKIVGTDFELLERVLGHSPIDTILNYVLTGIGKQADRFLGPPRNLGPKKPQ
jgi:hypothetical protein